MRLIDADALKKDWRMANKCEECLQDARKCQYEQNFTRMDICEMLDEAPTVGGWISVKDRMPDKSGTYLCYQPKAASICSLNTVRWSESKGYWMGKEVGSRIDGIEYWMSLPEPPKEDQDG